MSLNCSFVKKLLAPALLVTAFSASAAVIEVTDIAGRKVSLDPEKIENIVLGEGRLTYSLALLDKSNPLKRVVGWKDDLIQYDPDAYRKYLKAFPEIADIENLGSPYSGDYSLEKIITLDTDLFILNLGNLLQAQESGLLTKLEKAGIKVVFVDFRQRPTQNTVPSLLMLGKVLNREKEANEFIDYYVEQMRLVSAVVLTKKQEERPIVFIESAAGYDPDKCCNTFGAANLGRLVDEAGGINWGSRKISGFSGKVNPEVILTEKLDYIIGTGANWSEANPNTTAVLLGYEATSELAQERLQALADRKGWSELDAVKSKNFYSVYHQFYNSPYHFIALQTFAKWFYPDDFKDLDTEANFVELHDRFLPIDYSGVFWQTLK
ncbi:ABC transporter substrate-binding protein [Marinomonas ushuaiensis DSM 15871]|uniref:ABC transporter substrate-binding protein n=1 Tax=Marinomonas ushuaiensis DSM 15871 TaxID=1122207 RepID=X7E7A5_9GAMM|nr:ABC transporter substrate-binding protein [Marinomonas ushuaiensis]ETX11827.1 ABC transporter substrate-binding protein [Marinomonas ushuaiensis DSM 15871]